MNNSLSLIALSFILLSIVLLLLIMRELKSALSRTSFDAVKQKRIYTLTWICIAVWFTFISILALNGVFRNFSSMPPRLMIAILPMLIAIIGITLYSKNLGEILRYVSPARLMYIQSFRIAVELLLWALFLVQRLPELMTFEGRNFDIVAGITGPVFAWLCFRNGQWNRNLAIAWNIAGLLLLINIVTIAILSFPTPFQVFKNEPSNSIIAEFPFVLLPAVLVPVAYSMHFFSLRQLLHKK